MPDLQCSRCSICYGPRAFRGPALLLRFFTRVKQIKLFFLLAYDQPRRLNVIIFFTNKELHVRKMTCVLSCFPNVNILPRMYLCLMVTSYTGERSFSKLRRFRECPANDDWARTPKHADIDEYRERVATHD